MALQCGVLLNMTTYAAGQTPPPMATVVVYNPNASAVVVTALEVHIAPNRNTASRVVPPIGQGQTVSVPATSSINIGPFPVTFGWAAMMNPFYVQNNGEPTMQNVQGAQPTQQSFVVSCVVYGSDGSVNIGSGSGLLVSYTVMPPPGFAGGALAFNNSSNFLTGLVWGLL